MRLRRWASTSIGPSQGGGTDLARAEGGDDQVCGDVATADELRVHLVPGEIQPRQRVAEVGGDGALMGLGELLCDLGSESADPRDGRRGSENDIASGVVEDPGGFGSDEPCLVNEVPWGGCVLESGAHTARIGQGAKMRHPSAVQGCGAGDARRKGVRRASRGNDQSVIVHAGSGAQVDGLLERIHGMDAIADCGDGQCRKVCLVGFDEAGGDSLVNQCAVPAAPAPMTRTCAVSGMVELRSE